MRKHRGVVTAVLAAAGGAVLAFLGAARAEQMVRNGFETRDTAWVKGAADAAFRETAHEVTDQTAHTGQFSEHWQLTAEQGSFIYYFYPVGRAPVAEELSASVWVKGNRPGAQLLARLVLPHERNPSNLDEPLTTLLRGTTYQQVGRWQRLELRNPIKLAQEQQQLMQAQLKRAIDFTDAYIDRLVLNVYGGPGLTDVWTDDLEVGPVVDAPTPFQPASRVPQPPAAGPPPTPLPTPSRAPVVEMVQEQLQVSGKRFLIRGIRHSDTPLKALRDAGFNAVWMDYASPRALMEEAVNLGFWLVPSLPVTGNDPQLASPDVLTNVVAHFPDGDAVLFWDLGGGLVAEQAPTVARAAAVVHAADPLRPLGGDVWDGSPRYSRSLDLLGVHRWPLLTSFELSQYRDWLNQRRRLARPGIFLWTWIQTHLPDWYLALVYDRPATAGFDEPVGPQGEQIRLLTYIALAAGYKGLGFWSDRFLADSHQGRDRLLTLALLNQEIHMLEPMLVTADAPRWIDTSVPDVKAAVFHTDRGMLVLPIWMGGYSQLVPGQAASSRLNLVVPEVPDGTQAWEVSPGEVTGLEMQRVIGGTKVTLPEFGLTAAIVFTSDSGPTGLVVRFQDQARRWQQLAAQWTHDLAEVEIDKVAKVEAQLEAAGHPLPDGKGLMKDARDRLQKCVEEWNRNEFRLAYLEGQRALRPIRILMRAQWEEAVKAMNQLEPKTPTGPTASPYLLSFFTLPRHWRFLDQLRQTTPGANTLSDGNFEVGPNRTAEAWTPQVNTLDGDLVDLAARRVTEQPKEGQQCLMLEIKPKNPQLTPGALERTFLAINSPVVRLQPGTLVRISAWVRVPKPIKASPDGALFYDSIGGEPLAIRVIEGKEWRKFTLYRTVPASGTVNVTLALTGLGTAYFDDVRIEPLQPTSPGPTALRPGGTR
jgi:hypothetical protein